LAEVQTFGLDFFGDTLTLFGGGQAPRSFTVNLGAVDASITASFAADVSEAAVNKLW
jgi:hypothetical protein